MSHRLPDYNVKIQVSGSFIMFRYCICSKQIYLKKGSMQIVHLKEKKSKVEIKEKLLMQCHVTIQTNDYFCGLRRSGMGDDDKNDSTLESFT